MRKIIFFSILILCCFCGLNAQTLSVQQIRQNLINQPPNEGDFEVRRESILDLDQYLLVENVASNADIKDFYESMMDKVADEFAQSYSARADIWILYNHGFLVKTPDIVIAFDIVHAPYAWTSYRLPAGLIDAIDILFVSHIHGDHLDSRVTNRVLDNGKYVVVPQEISSNGNVAMRPGENVMIEGVSMKAHDGLHSVPVRIYEVTLPNGLKFVHTGDNQTSETLPNIEDVDVLFLNGWVNESGGASAVTGMRNSMAKLNPDIMIPGHFQEIMHSPDMRAHYEWGFEVNDPRVQVMAWGERFIIPEDADVPATFQNRALKIMNSGEYGEVPHNASLALSQITMECWINANGESGEQQIIDKRSPDGGYNLRITGNQFPLAVQVVVKDNNEAILYVPGIVQKRTWTHLAASYDGQELRLYVNGDFIASKAVSKNISNTTVPLRIGEYNGYPNGSLVFHGLIDDLRLWNVARTETEIKANLHSFLNGDIPDLIAYYKFDALDTDEIIDSSSRNNNGQRKSTAVNVPSTAPIGDEAVNRAIHFEESGAYADIAHEMQLSPAQITIECWIKKDGQSNGEHTILDKRDGDSGYNLRLAGDSFPLTAFIVFKSNGQETIIGGPRIMPHTWTHLAATYDGQSIKFYQDGKLTVQHDAAGLDISQSDATLRIGEFLGYPGGSLPFGGDIDELRIWNYARTETEINRDMHRNLSALEAGLCGYWRFNEARGTTAFDKSQHENNATLYPSACFVISDAPIGFDPPPTPVGFRAHGEDRSVTLHWKPVERDNISQYLIYRSSTRTYDQASYCYTGTVPHPDSTFSITSLFNNRNYYYRITSVDDEGHESQLSPVVCGSPFNIPDDYFTGVYYYPWYSNSWGHHWQGSYVRDYLSPRQSPVLGEYDCRDQEVIRQHLDWCRQFGIDLWVCSWWGVSSNEDITIKDHIVPELQNDDVKFAIFYESFILGNVPWVVDPAMEMRMINDYTYIANTYFNHPNYFRIDNRPVVYVYVGGGYQGNYETAFQNLRQAMQNLGHDIYLVGDEMGWSAPSAHAKIWDAVTAYNFLGAQDYGIDSDFFGALSMSFDQWEQYAGDNDLEFIPLAVPGFNNRKSGQTSASNSIVIPRQSTAGANNQSYFEEYIHLARTFVDSDLKLLMITSWNEWHEDTQIEPINDAASTNSDNSPSGNLFTNGYDYEGYGTKNLELVRDLLGSSASSVTENNESQPAEYRLLQNYPNPFNAETVIVFEVPEKCYVSLKVFDLLGREKAKLVDQQMESGVHRIRFNSSHFATGLYIYKIEMGDYVGVRKMVVLK